MYRDNSFIISFRLRLRWNGMLFTRQPLLQRRSHLSSTTEQESAEVCDVRNQTRLYIRYLELDESAHYSEMANSLPGRGLELASVYRHW